MIVIARHGRPPWTRPVSQQEYLEAAISRLELISRLETEGQATVPQTETPAAARQRDWQRESAARQQQMNALVEETRHSNPALAQTLRRNHQQLELEMAEAMRKGVEIEQRKAERAKGQPKPARPLTLADRLARHRERLAAMSPDEHRAQARPATPVPPCRPSSASSA